MVTKRRTSTEQEKSNYQVETTNEAPATIDIPQFEFSTNTASQKSNIRETYAQPTKSSERSSASDVMPSIRTMTFFNSQNVKQPKSRDKLELKTKIMLAIYMLAVIALSAIVIATGVAVSNITNRVNGLETEYAAQAEVLQNQYTQIDRLTDPDYIRGRAFGNGMQSVEDQAEIPLLEMEERVSYSSRTNWFDSFCKWVASIIGG